MVHCLLEDEEKDDREGSGWGWGEEGDTAERRHCVRRYKDKLEDTQPWAFSDVGSRGKVTPRTKVKTGDGQTGCWSERKIQ